MAACGCLRGGIASAVLLGLRELQQIQDPETPGCSELWWEGARWSVKEDEAGEMHWGQAEPQVAFRGFVLFIPTAVGNDCWRRHETLINVLNIDEPL